MASSGFWVLLANAGGADEVMVSAEMVLKAFWGSRPAPTVPYVARPQNPPEGSGVYLQPCQQCTLTNPALPRASITPSCLHCSCPLLTPVLWGLCRSRGPSGLSGGKRIGVG